MWILPLPDVRHCCKLSTYSISWKTNDPNSSKYRKTSFWVWFRPTESKFYLPIFFFKNLASSFTRYYCRLLSYTISEKTNDPILRTDGQDNEGDYTGPYPKNIKHLKTHKHAKIVLSFIWCYTVNLLNWLMKRSYNFIFNFCFFFFNKH